MGQALLVFEPDEALRKATVVAVQKTLQNSHRVLVSGDVGKAPPAVKEANPVVVFLGLTQQPQGALKAGASIARDFPDVGIVFTARQPQPQLVLAAMRAGGDDLVTHPIQETEMRAVLKKVIDKKGTKRRGQDRQGRILTVFSGKGGCGVTTVIANLGTNLAAMAEGDVVAVDMNLQLGTLASFLDVEAHHSVADVAKEVERLDGALARTYMVKHASGLYVLPGPQDPEEGEGVSGAEIGELLKFLRQTFEFVLVDTPHTFDDVTLSAFDASDVIVVTTDMVVPSVKNTARCLDLLQRLQYDERKVRILVNRYCKSSVSIKNVREAIKRPIHWVVPNDFAAVTTAIDTGVPVGSVAPKSEIALSFARMAEGLAGRAAASPSDARPSGRWFRSLLKGRRNGTKRPVAASHEE